MANEVFTRATPLLSQFAATIDDDSTVDGDDDDDNHDVDDDDDDQATLLMEWLHIRYTHHQSAPLLSIALVCDFSALHSTATDWATETFISVKYSNRKSEVQYNAET